MSVATSNEFFINMKEKDIPKWDNKLSYYDQDKYSLEFYSNEFDKIVNGVNVNGTFIHPWLYWHFNFFKTKIAKKDNTEPIMVPPLDDNAWYFAENYKEAEEKGLGVCMFGTRGFSKTVLEASVVQWLANTKYNGIININGGSSKDLKDVCLAIQLSNENIHPAFRLPILKEDWEKDVLFGAKESNNSSVFQSRLDILNLEDGKGKASEKAAGGTPVGFVVDEIGKFDPRDLLRSALPKFFSQYGAKLVHILAGTGGNSELSEGAKYVLENPEIYKLLPMNWDRLDNSVSDEFITWKQSKAKQFCTYVPGQFSYRNGCEKKDTTLADYVGKPEDKKLKKVKMRVTDWEKATPFCIQEVERLPEGEDKNKRIMYYPLKVEDCFLTDSPNPFDIVRAQKKLQKVLMEPKYRLVDLNQEYDGSISYELSDKKLAPREYKGKSEDAPIMLFSELENKANKYENIAGGDDYKLLEASESTSLGTMYVLKRRNNDIDQPLEKILASYAARTHESHSILHNNFRLMLKGFRALCNIEAIDVGFADYLDTMGFNLMEYLTPNINPSHEISSTKRTKANSRYGTYPTPQNKALLLKTVVEYTRERVVVGYTTDNEPIMEYGMDYIEDPYLLEEIINFRPGGNYDRIMGFGWALVYSRYLDKKNIQPKKEVVYTDEYYIRNNEHINKGRKQQTTRFQNFSTVRFKNF